MSKITKTVKEPELRVQKLPKTIKVSTVIKSVIVTAAIAASFICGWFAHINDSYRVQAEASNLVKTINQSK